MYVEKYIGNNAKYLEIINTHSLAYEHLLKI